MMYVRFEEYHEHIQHHPTLVAALFAGDVPAVLRDRLDCSEGRWWRFRVGRSEFVCSAAEADEIATWLDRVAPLWRGGGTKLAPDGITQFKRLPLCEIYPLGQQPWAKSANLDYLAAEWARRDATDSENEI